MSEFNNDIDELISKVTNANVCPMVRLFSNIQSDHGKEAEAKIAEIVNDPNYSASRIVTMLRKHGYKTSRDSVYKHRNKGKPDGCMCNT